MSLRAENAGLDVHSTVVKPSLDNYTKLNRTATPSPGPVSADETETFQQSIDARLLELEQDLHDTDLSGDPKASLPTSIDEKYLELETRIVKECIREFTKGNMFFSYDFGRNF